MASPNELCCMDAVTLAQQIRKKGVSPREVINAVLARMEKLEPILHASVYGSCLAGSGEAEVRTARP